MSTFEQVGARTHEAMPQENIELPVDSLKDICLRSLLFILLLMIYASNKLMLFVYTEAFVFVDRVFAKPVCYLVLSFCRSL